MLFLLILAEKVAAVNIVFWLARVVSTILLDSMVDLAQFENPDL